MICLLVTLLKRFILICSTQSMKRNDYFSITTNQVEMQKFISPNFGQILKMRSSDLNSISQTKHFISLKLDAHHYFCSYIISFETKFSFSLSSVCP